MSEPTCPSALPYLSISSNVFNSRDIPVRGGECITCHLGKNLRNRKATCLAKAATEDWQLELRSLTSRANAPTTRLCAFSEASQPGNMFYANLQPETALQS